MSRKYNKVKNLETEVFKLKEEGKTNQEITEILGFSDLESLKNLIKRHNRCKRENKVPVKRGRPRKNPLKNEQTMKSEIVRLQMENELLRNFLLEIGRG